MQEKTTRRQADRREATQASLIAAARDLFAAQGFAGVGAPEIALAAGVTRGAITHHFKDKLGLFDAVVRAEAAAVSDMLSEMPASDMGAAIRAWFVTMQVPGRARILLIDGPAALGSAEMARIDAETGARELGLGLAQMLPGRDPTQIAALTELLSAGFDRAALRVAEGAAPAPYINAITGLIDGLS